MPKELVSDMNDGWGKRCLKCTKKPAGLLRAFEFVNVIVQAEYAACK